MLSKLFHALFLAVLAVATIAGCGRSTGRLGLSGAVRLDGAPVDRGSINFDPINGPVHTTAGAMIIDGRYTVADAQGLLPGRYRVRVFWPQSSGETPSDPGPLGGVPGAAPRERIPDRYNLKSELTVEIKPDSSNRFDFDLSSGTR